MSNLKISQLDPITIPLQDQDLIAVVQNVSGNLVTKRASVGNLKSILNDAAGNVGTLLYTGGETAVEATEDEILFFDTLGEEPMVVLNPETSMLDLHSIDSETRRADLKFTYDGFRAQRIDGDYAAQIRVDSEDAYLNARCDIEILAGTKTNDADALKSLDVLSSDGRIKLRSGGRIDAQTYQVYSTVNEVNGSVTKKAYNNLLSFKNNGGGLELTQKVVTKNSQSTYLTEEIKNRLVFADSSATLITPEFKLRVGGSGIDFDESSISVLNNVVYSYVDLLARVTALETQLNG